VIKLMTPWVIIRGEVKGSQQDTCGLDRWGQTRTGTGRVWPSTQPVSDVSRFSFVRSQRLSPMDCDSEARRSEAAATDTNIFIVFAIAEAPPGMFTHGELLLVTTTLHIVEPNATSASPELVQRLLNHNNDTFHQAIGSQARDSKRSRSPKKLCWRDNPRTDKQQPCRE
jgi:hypothetical protein